MDEDTLHEESEIPHAEEEDDDGPPVWGGGPDALTTKVGMLSADVERIQEGLGHMIAEADEIFQAAFERFGILHMRACRLEAACGLPPWRTPPGSPRGDCSATGEDMEEGDSTLGELRTEATSSASKTCCRGHPLVADANVEPIPRRCGFCKMSTQTSFRCSEGCYFHACASCMKCSAAAVPTSCCGEEADGKLAEDCCQEFGTGCNSEAVMTQMSTCIPDSDASSKCSTSEQTAISARSTSSLLAAQEEQEDFSTARCSRSNSLPLEDTMKPGSALQEGISGMQDDTPTPRHAPGRPPRCPLDATKGMKARLCSLEEEVQALAKKLAEHAPPSEGEANLTTGCTAEQFKEFAEAMRAELAEVRLPPESSCTLEALEDLAETLREEFRSSLAKGMQDLRCQEVKDLCDKIDGQQDGLNDVTVACHDLEQRSRNLQQELTSQVDDIRQGTSADIDSLRQGVAELRSKQAQFVQRKELEDLVGGMSEMHTTDGARGVMRGRLRASSRPPPEVAGAGTGESPQAGHPEHVPIGSAQDRALAQSISVLAKAMGMIPAGQQLGQGAGAWSELGKQLEEAWTSRSKACWGGNQEPPAWPDIFAVMQQLQQQDARLPAVSRMALKLPDRREGARLAARLAAIDAASLPPRPEGPSLAKQASQPLIAESSKAPESTKPPARRFSQSATS
mmetsp:Transcript_35326/g.82501  ORF Transcript_35326/g.82501 Transcript_35326/m.82501 type:complete len:681 (+) Transcript_35326:73-2115(+)